MEDLCEHFVEPSLKQVSCAGAPEAAQRCYSIDTMCLSREAADAEQESRCSSGRHHLMAGKRMLPSRRGREAYLKRHMTKITLA